MKTNRSGFTDHTYTTISTVQNARNAFQCLDLYYYVTDASNDAKISVGWTAGMAPFPIEEVRAELDNKWQHSRITYATPAAPMYSVRKLVVLGIHGSLTKRYCSSSGLKYYAIQEMRVSHLHWTKSMSSMVPVVKHKNQSIHSGSSDSLLAESPTTAGPTTVRNLCFTLIVESSDMEFLEEWFSND